MAKEKAKWLVEASTQELLVMVEQVLKGDLDDKDVKKAQKIMVELKERTPEVSDEAMSVEEALAVLESAVTQAVSMVAEAYKAEVTALGDTDDESEEDPDDEDEEEGTDYDELSSKELKALCKEKGIKAKGLDKEGMIAALVELEEEEEEEDEEDEEDGTDYEELSQKELKVICRERGLKVNKSMKKADFIKALEADDKE